MREWTALALGVIGTVLGVSGFLKAAAADARAAESERVANIIATEQTLAEAWDLLGGRIGSTVIYELNANPGELEQARRLIWEVLQRDSRHAKARRYMAVYYESTNRMDSAIAEYEKSIELDSTQAATFNNLGVALATAGNFDSALAVFSKAAEYGADEILTLINVSITMAEAGRRDEADVVLARVQELLADARNRRLYIDSSLAGAIRSGRFYEMQRGRARPMYRSRARRGPAR